MDRLWCTDCNGKFIHAHTGDISTVTMREKVPASLKSIIIKWAIIILGMTLLLTIALVWPPREYKLVEENGSFYMYIDKKYIQPKYCDCMIDGYGDQYKIHFDSLKEMVTDLRKGRFTVKEFHRLGHSADKDGRIALHVDINHLYEAVLPEGLPYDIEFTPNGYSFCANFEDPTVSVKLELLDYDSFCQGQAEAFDHAPAIKPDATNSTVPLEETYCVEMDGWSIYYYILSTEAVQYYVSEAYYPADSRDVPARIDIYAQKADGTYFRVHIGCSQRPEIAWLASFNIQPYEP